MPFLEQTLDQWQWMLDVMLTGPMLCSQAAIPHMLEVGRGKIVNVGSVTGIIGLTKRAAYAAAKAGLHGLTRALAYELSSQGIWVNAVAPGLLETPMNTAYFQDEQFMQLVKRELPVGGWASPTRSPTSSSSWPRMNRTSCPALPGTWMVAGSRARVTRVRRVVTVGPRQVRIQDAPEPIVAPGDVLVGVEAVGLCGSDIHFYLGDYPYVNYPRTQGHEFVGIVEELGGDVTGLAVGQRVAVEPLMPCGTCLPCRRGHRNCCTRMKTIGVQVDGGLCERIALPAANLYRHRRPAGGRGRALRAAVDRGARGRSGGPRGRRPGRRLRGRAGRPGHPGRARTRGPVSWSWIRCPAG